MATVSSRMDDQADGDDVALQERPDVGPGEHGDDGRHARRHGHGDGQQVVHHQRRARDERRDRVQVVAGDGVRAAAFGIGVDDLDVRQRDDQQQRTDGNAMGTEMERARAAAARSVRREWPRSRRRWTRARWMTGSAAPSRSGSASPRPARTPGGVRTGCGAAAEGAVILVWRRQRVRRGACGPRRRRDGACHKQFPKRRYNNFMIPTVQRQVNRAWHLLFPVPGQGPPATGGLRQSATLQWRVV